MRAHEFELPPHAPRGAEDLVAEIARSTSDAAARSAAALALVYCDIIAGEGPTVAGRAHFSRTIDAADAALCARILCAAGHAGHSVSRAEADALFAIDAVGSERVDDGRFDDLLAKAVLHHLMGAAGTTIPGREQALARDNPLDDWGSAIVLAAEPRSWLAGHLDWMKPSSPAARTIDAVLHVNPAGPRLPLGILFNMEA
ncbi:hypothetical protein ACVIHI_004718 [Bradyrhizobium sp. USDA 4524]|uniref:hypothetical protein n=1 Tax=Bradyrhizobium TaxID=374 RepID=UPI0020A07445|nr:MULTISPECIES: hypothetical protein [Bradyrhizobium]MCP1842364.1 hypothetical protein [Bradyrhizobium sp. USDA 4538]MCP1902928.1 hypothetical protein [Bradyrhizobium sp. USDA 4537]MCP1991415.1 hypothetical protein [Bradyrhizobium sp. USDA 4539]MCP3417239.1 hypothetical protein [Bradyrhizobium brasilense]